MMKKLLISIGILLSLLGILAVPVYAQTAQDSVCAGIGATSGGSGCSNPAGSPDLNKTIATVVNILSIAVGVVAVIMIIVAGLKFITAQGDSNSIASARNTILYAIVGLAVAALAQVIVHFVLNRVKP